MTVELATALVRREGNKTESEIDRLRGHATRPTDTPDHWLRDQPLAVGDLILAGVLQGLAGELLHCNRDFEPFAAYLGLRCVIQNA